MTRSAEKPRQARKTIPPITITCKTGDHHLFQITNRDDYTSVRATIAVYGFKREIDSTDLLVIKVTNTITGGDGYQQSIEQVFRTTEVTECPPRKPWQLCW